ncbi:hypothetical protein ASPBRDRAFT_190085 [Aspergillus brasiliensis CBS 101740]|uniref:Rhodopsin domain-containing protein n=1 Tax=Aspergillus brasiliensis (strain CBS 101740 / IMI 381727 / IBT 21946) TaxID=767769 RepID=A0A1L9U1B9_ASPBC|nr:hypothetical protein ASPBRDRAFT_190085 [Aspergillus brasiliensis CBS 101740]
MAQHSNGWYIVPPCIIAITMATVAVILRFIARYKLKNKIGPDDILIVIAVIFAYAHMIDVILFIHFAYLGAHFTSIPRDKSPLFFKFVYSIGVLAPSLLLPVKLSFVFLYHRYFFAYRIFTITCIITGIIVFMHWLAFGLLFILICLPPARFWEPAIPGRCLDIAAVGDGFAVSSLLTDVAILILPIPLIWQLHLSKGQKVALTVIFMLGGL